MIPMKLNRTLKRAIDIMQLLKENRDGLTIKEISRLLNIPVTSAFDIVHTLYEEKYLEYARPDSKIFTIGVRAFEVGSSYRLHKNYIEIIHPYVEKLMRMSHATSFFAIADNDEIIYLDKVEADTSIRTTAELGSRKNMYATGLGKAIMMYYPEEKVRAIFASKKIAAFTEFTILSAEKFLRELKIARKRGFAIDNRESDLNTFCIAHAILDSYGNPIGSISIATLYTMVNDSFITEYGNTIREYAFEISRKIGFMEPGFYPSNKKNN